MADDIVDDTRSWRAANLAHPSVETRHSTLALGDEKDETSHMNQERSYLPPEQVVYQSNLKTLERHHDQGILSYVQTDSGTFART